MRKYRQETMSSMIRRLINDGYTNAEIADRVFKRYPTTKHTHFTLGLEVEDNRERIARRTA